MTMLSLTILLVILQLTIPAYGGNTSGTESHGNRSHVAAPTKEVKAKEKLSILIVAPGLYFSKSHLNFAVSIAKVLAEKHTVHLVITCRKTEECAVNESTPNLVIQPYIAEDEALLKQFLEAKRDREIITNFWQVFREMINKNYLKGQKFDVGIAEMSTINQYSFALFHALGIKKTVTIKAFSLSPQQYHDLTDLDNKTELKLMDKLRNADPPVPVVKKTQIGDHSEMQTARKATIHSDYDSEVKNDHEDMAKTDEEFQGSQYEGRPFPGMIQMFKETRFLWINTQNQTEWDDGMVFEGAKKVGMIGGIHLKKHVGAVDKAISDKLNKMNKSKEVKKSGKKAKVVLISFGTVVNTITKMNDQQFQAIRDTIKDFATEKPQYLFVWQLTEGDGRIELLNSSDLPNVYATHWVNMQALLAHKVKPSRMKKKEAIVAAFLSHCGRNSQLESVYYSIPTICVPNFMDQYYNAETLAKKQMSIVLDFEKHSGTAKHTAEDAFTKERIKHALSQALGLIKSTTIKLDKVKKIGKEFNNQIKTRGPRKVILDHMEQIEAELNDEKGN